MKIETLVLSSKDIKKVAQMGEILEVVADAFRTLSRGDAQMPPKLYIDVPEHNGDFRAMPAYSRALKSAGLKWVTSYSKNTRLPAVIGIYILSRSEDGYPLALMDGTYMTNLRTGAAAGVATRALMRKDASIFAFLGCGRQSKFAYLALREACAIKQIRLYDRDPGRARAHADFIAQEFQAVSVCPTVKECAGEADVVTTTTPSRSPILWKPDIKPGVHINAMGADAKGKQELDPAILKDARVVIDDWGQTPHSGEVNVPIEQGRFKKEDIVGTIGEVLRSVKPGRQKPDDVTVFDSTGLAVQDLGVAKYLYDKCVKSGLGTRIEIYEES